MRLKVFRWRGIGPLLLLFMLLGVGWALFADRLAEDTGEEAATELLGTQVDLTGLRIRETAPAIQLDRIQVADPFDPDRNLIDTGPVSLDLDPEALLEKKLVVNQLVVRDVRVGTRRASPARPASSDGFAFTLLGAMRDWRDQFDVPLLRLSAIDSVRQLVLDPGQLGTLRAASELRSLVDSLKTNVNGDIAALDPRPVVDSAVALAERLAGQNVRSLGLLGARDAVRSVRRTLAAVDSLKRRADTVRIHARRGFDRLAGAVTAIDDARRRDYEFARSLLQLPSFDGPEIGRALFGDVSIDRFQQTVYWAQMAERYLPAGLQPRRANGPRRLRRSGTTVRFPTRESIPSFLLRDGQVNLAFDAAGAEHTVAAAVRGVTSEPAVYGAPATLTLDGTVGGQRPVRVWIDALADHTALPYRDSATATMTGFRLPALSIPGLGLRVDPGIGSTRFEFSRRGDGLLARWTLRADRAVWQRDSGTVAGPDLVGLAIWPVLSALERLDVTAELSGSFASPRLSIRSNLDEAIASRLKSLAGDALARAEARVRAEVDRHVAEPVGIAQAAMETARGDVGRRLDALDAELARVRATLEERLRAIGGLGGD